MKTKLALVHGGMCGSWVWERFIPHLNSSGVQVENICLDGLGERSENHSPHIGLEHHGRDVETFLKKQNEPVTFVVHSYGSLPVLWASRDYADKIQKLIFLDAVVPHPGESTLDALDEDISQGIQMNALMSGAGWQVPAIPDDAWGFETKEDCDFVRGKSTPQSIKSFKDNVEFDPKIYEKVLHIHCEKFPPLKSMVSRAQTYNIPVVNLDSDHYPMIHQPEQLSKIILESIMVESL